MTCGFCLPFYFTSTTEPNTSCGSGEAGPGGRPGRGRGVGLQGVGRRRAGTGAGARWQATPAATRGQAPGNGSGQTERRPELDRSLGRGQGRSGIRGAFPERSVRKHHDGLQQGAWATARTGRRPSGLPHPAPSAAPSGQLTCGQVGCQCGRSSTTAPHRLVLLPQVLGPGRAGPPQASGHVPILSSLGGGHRPSRSLLKVPLPFAPGSPCSGFRLHSRRLLLSLKD